MFLKSNSYVLFCKNLILSFIQILLLTLAGLSFSPAGRIRPAGRTLPTPNLDQWLFLEI